MKSCLKKFLFISLNLLISNLFAQEKTAMSMDYMPNANFLVIKIKNALDLTYSLKGPPFDSLAWKINFPVRYNNITKKLKKWYENEKPNEINAEILNELKNWMECVEPVELQIERLKEIEINETNETKETDILQNEIKFYKNSGEDKILNSLTGEIIITVSIDGQSETFIQLKDSINLTIAGQVHRATFQKGIDHLLLIAKHNKSNSLILIKEHENAKYFVIEKFKNTSTCFVACINDIAVISNKEDLLKKTLTTIAKKGVYENGLNINEKFVSYLNKNTSKDAVFAFDAAMIFKNLLKKQMGVGKLFLESMKFDELLEGYGFLEISNEVDTIEFSLKALDEGFLQFATFTNREFTPSYYIRPEVMSYSKIFFSMSELKKRIFDIGAKVSPGFIQQVQGILDMAKTNYQIDIDTILTSFGADMETFSPIKKNDSQESILTHKLKNTETFTANLKNILSSPEIYNKLKYSFLPLENKEKDFSCWQLIRGENGFKQSSKFAIGATENFAFIIRNSLQNFGPQFGKGIAYDPKRKINSNLLNPKMK
jgi:hypothetical protein